MSGAMTIQGTPPREKWAARFAAVAGLVLILVAACISAFSMLIWGQ
jgi:hypothetical protein